MNKVTQINLNGKAYQLEESGYIQLRNYLDEADRKLKDNPDKNEILADFEQVIADKCDQHLEKDKDVVSTEQMATILQSIGPVEDDTYLGNAEPKKDEPQKRLYRIQKGAPLAGVCAGLAEYLNVDVTVLRLLLVVLLFATSGGIILFYFILAIVLPDAKTPEQLAELRGERFTAQDLLLRAKDKYAEMRGEPVDHDDNAQQSDKPALSQVGEILRRLGRLAAAIVGVLATIKAVLLTLLLVLASWIVVSGRVTIPVELKDIPTSILVLSSVVGYYLLVLPLILIAIVFLRLARRKTSFAGSNLWTLAVAGAVWLIALLLAGLVTLTYHDAIGTFWSNHSSQRPFIQHCGTDNSTVIGMSSSHLNACKSMQR